MPTYEYACKNCDHEFEQFQSMRDEPLKKCPECGKNSLRRKVGGGAGLIFKGSGFYITDYKNKGSGASKTSDPKPGGEAKPAPSTTAAGASGAAKNSAPATKS